MKIKEFKEIGNMLKIYTDEGEFVFQSDRFGSVEELKRKIERTIILDKKKIEIKKARKDKIIKDLTEEVKNNGRSK